MQLNVQLPNCRMDFVDTWHCKFTLKCTRLIIFKLILVKYESQNNLTSFMKKKKFTTREGETGIWCKMHIWLKYRISVTLHDAHLMNYMKYNCRSQLPRGLSRRSAAARLLRSWVRIPPGAWMFVCCECCVLSDRGLCDELITRPEESYRLWCVGRCVWSRNLMNEEAMARVGPQRHKKKNMKYNFGFSTQRYL